MKLGVAHLLAVVAVASTVGARNAANSTASSTGAECASTCPEVYQPVCGSDDVTYSNKCFLNLAACNNNSKISQVSEGECAATASPAYSARSGCSEDCIRIYRPVCGSDGVTYSNDCVLGVAQCKSGGAITQVSGGQCPPASASSSKRAESSVEVGDNSSCENRVCTMDYNPVCGSDGVTYSNSCMLGLANCKDSNITKASDGDCAATK